MGQTDAIREFSNAVVTAELDRRPSRAPDYKAENQALTLLIEAMSTDPGTVLQRLVEVAMELTRSDSAGICLFDPGAANGKFRWVAKAGVWSSFRDGTMPREASPCDEVIAREAVLLMKNPERTFPALLQAEPGISEGLLAPFHLGGVPVGTVWTIKHSPDDHFDTEDARILKSLACFAAAVHQTADALQLAKAAGQQAEIRVQHLVALAEVSSEFFGTCDMEFMPVYGNAAAMQMVGLADLDEVKRTPVQDFFFPEDVAFITNEFFPRVLREGQAKVEIRFRHFVTGEPVWVDYSLVVLKDETGQATGLGTVKHDLTERKRVEAILRESEERQAFLLELSDALRLTDDPMEVQDKATQLVGAHLRLNRAYYCDVHEDGDWATIREGYLDGVASNAGRVRMSDYGGSIGDDFREGRTVVISDTTNDARTTAEQSDAYAAMSVAAWVGVPLVKGGRVVAVLGATQSQPRQWTEAEVTLLAAVAERTWAAVEQTRAETALRENESKYCTLFEKMQEGFSVLERVPGEPVDYRFLAANPAYQRHTGLSNPVGRTIREIAPSVEESALECYRSVEETGLSRIVVTHVPEIDIWLEVEASSAERSGQIAVLFRDITDRKRAEAALQESEEKYRTLFQSIDEGFAIIELLPASEDQSPDFRFVEVNAAFEGQTGTRDVTGMLGSEFNRETNAVWVKMFVEVVRAGEAKRIECYHQETARWYDMFATRIGGADSRQVGVVFADTTGRREREERQAFLLKLSDALRPLAEPLAVQFEAMRVLGQHLGVNRAQYHEIEPDNEWIKPGGGYANGVPLHFNRSRMNDFGAFVREAYEAGRTLVVFDTELDARLDTAERAAFVGIGVRAFIGVPLVKNGRFVGLLGLDHATARSWSQAEIWLAEEVAERTWAAVARARAEADLQKSETHFRALATVGSSSIYRMSPDWHEMRQLDGAAFLASTITATAAWVDTYIPLDERPRVRGAIKQAIAAKGVFELEHRVLRANGSVGWTFSRAIPLLDDAGEILEWFGAATDVTARVKADQSFARLFQASPAPFLVLKPDAPHFTIAEVNDAYLSATMRKRDEVVGRGIFEAYPNNPFDRTTGGVSILQASLEQVLASRQPDKLPFLKYAIERQDGTFEERWWNPVNSAVIGDDGEVEALIHNANDVTEERRAELALRESERRLQVLMEGIPQLVWRTCDQGLWTWTSPQWLDFTGQTQEESRGQGWQHAVHPDDQEGAKLAWAEARPHGLLDIEYRVRRAADGAWLWHHTRSVPVRNEDGHIVEWLGTSTDVQLMKEFQERQVVLVGELQHRTRNLIAIVHATSENTARSSPDLNSFRTRFHARLEALARVQGLLSRLDDRDRVSFDELLKAELSAIGGDGSKITLQGPPDIRLRSSTVQTLAMALHELATNAIKYGALRERAGRLTVSWRLEAEGEGRKPWLHVDWRETGVTIPPLGPTLPGSGHGRELIERALPYQLNAKTSYHLGPDGVHCTISLPVSTTGVNEYQHG